MRRWLVVLAVLLGLSPATAFWQSRDSNYDVAVSAGGFTGPGDVVGTWSAWYGLRAFSAATTGTKAANVCNSGDANCADVNTLANGNFDVTTAQGAPLNCGGTGGTCTIKTLYDKSGALKCGGSACDVTNATAASRPTLTFSCIGSLPCMTFTRTSSQNLVSSGVTAAVSQPYTFVGVGDYTGADGTFSYIIAQNGPGIGNDFGGTALAFGLDQSGANVITATATDNAFHAVQGIFNGASPNSIITVDGTDTTGTFDTNATGSGLGVAIGSNSSAAHFYLGKIVEAGFAPSAFSGTTRTNMNSNIHNYWGF